tara:strand:+ start:723 stop:1142 length:420 start_codon:yes stop_codon:yes gene_type:complete
MAITQAMCTSFKTEALSGVHDLDTDVIKLALFTSAATLNAATTAYSSASESAGTGYTPAGNTLSGASISSDGTTATVTFSPTTWANATFVSRGALIYNSSKANKAIAVLDFGADQTVSAGDFAVIFPAATASDAIIRIS